MSRAVISIEHLSKSYRLGQIGTGRLTRDFVVWLSKIQGKPSPYQKVGSNVHERSLVGETIWALKDINLQIRDGDVLGIIGHNGAGKSTLLKILSRVTSPTSGLAHVKGRIASLLEVGTGFNAELTGRENIYLNGAILGMRRSEVSRKFDEIVAFSEVEEFIDTPVKRYSSGMYVRLAFAVAAHLEPEILIVDEVLAVGDAEFQRKCMGKMGSEAQKGRTILFVSHNMASINQLCSRAVLLQHGQITAMGAPKEIINQYLNELSSGNGFEKVVDRRGNGDLRFQHAYLTNADGQPITKPIAGEDCNLVFEYRCKVLLKWLRFTVTIYNGYGVAVTHLSTKTINRTYSLDGSGRVICTIPRLPLPRGSYRVAVSAFNENEMVDHVPSAVTFDVLTSNFYPAPFDPPPNAVTALVDHSWRIEQDDH